VFVLSHSTESSCLCNKSHIFSELDLEVVYLHETPRALSWLATRVWTPLCLVPIAMCAETQFVPGRSQLQLAVFPRRAELDNGDPSSASIAASVNTTYHTFLDADHHNEPPSSPCQPFFIPETALRSSSPKTVHRHHRHAVQPIWSPPHKESLMNYSPAPWVCYSTYKR
jgi:hypothetical protein